MRVFYTGRPFLSGILLAGFFGFFVFLGALESGRADEKDAKEKKDTKVKKDTKDKAPDREAKEVVQQVVKAAGGEDRLLKLFRIKEHLVVNADPKAKGSVRTSILEPPTYWWIGKRERVKEEKEPATFLVWAWTLGAITDPKSKLQVLPDIKEGESAAFGLRVSGTITPALDIYFDKEKSRLLRIDWRQDIHRFSDWKEHDGTWYPAKCVGYRKASGKPWYYSEILELERLRDLPKGLKRE